MHVEVRPRVARVIFDVRRHIYQRPERRRGGALRNTTPSFPGKVRGTEGSSAVVTRKDPLSEGKRESRLESLSALRPLTTAPPNPRPHP